MGICGGRRKAFEVRPEQKWDYISLGDFKSGSGFTVAAYIYVYISILISLAVYGVDSFTAVSLLAFGKWTSSINPNQFIDFSIQKWIFSICIIASFVNLGFEHIRAWRVMRRGSVAECYLDNLAVKMESTRMGRGQGWRRFLVFAELTKSKKGAEYVALFTYFSFQSWIRVIFCSGPRQFVNALTLYAVFTSEGLIADGGSADKTIMNFFDKIGALANESYQQAAVLSGMVFTLFIWVFSALSLLLAALFYVFFLWHYIPKQDGGLSGYCERKINKRLMKVVATKVNKAIAEEERQRVKAELRAAKKAGVDKPPVGRQAKPTIPDLDSKKEDSLPGMPTLARNDTMATLPLYTSRPASPAGIEMNSLDQKRPLPQRTGTTNTLASQSSYSSRAPLMGSAAGMGFDRSPSPVPTLPQVDVNNYPPMRTGTAQSNHGFAQPTLPQVEFDNYPPMRPGTAQSNRSYAQGQSLHRVQTSNSSNFGASYAQSPSEYQSDQLPSFPPPIRSQTAVSMDAYGRPAGGPNGQFGPGPRPGPASRSMDDGMSGPPGQPIFGGAMGGRGSPAPSNITGPPGRSMYDNGAGGRASPAPSNFTGPPGRPSFENGPGGRASPTPSNFTAYPGRPTYDNGMGGRASPAPSNFSNQPSRPMYEDEMSGRASPAPSNYSNRGPLMNRPGYNGSPMSPLRSATGPLYSPNRAQIPPQRNMTAPMPQRQDDYIMRPGTAASQRSMPMSRPGPGNNYNDVVDSQRGPPRW